MTTRKLYSEELVQLSESLEEMGNLVEASLKNLFFSIENKDMQLAERIVADDRNVNNLERSIEAQCLMLITTQQPIAQDLRTVSSILKVVTDIERIGDHASDIAELIQQMDHKQLERYSGHLQPMIAASGRWYTRQSAPLSPGIRKKRMMSSLPMISSTSFLIR